MAQAKADFSDRVARFSALDLLPAQRRATLPQAVADLIWSRRLLPVLTRDDAEPNPFGTEVPIRGAGDLTITYAECPPGTGPGLHAHRATFETFTVLQGRFCFIIADGDDASAGIEVVLDRFDALSVPPGFYRGFRNVSEETGLLQVIITGGIHDRNDIFFPVSIAREIDAAGQGCLQQFRDMGLQFEQIDNRGGQ